MSNYFDFVCDARREIVALHAVSDVEGGHGGRRSVVRWGGVLAYLLLPGDEVWQPGRDGVEYMGRWRSGASGTCLVKCDAVDDVDWYHENYRDVTADVVADARRRRGQDRGPR